MPLVSVLLPARNECKVIETVIRSLQNQVYPHFEVWIGDDGSTDGTSEKVQFLTSSDPRFHLIPISSDPSGRLQGKTQALQVLGGQANGELILMTDADMDLPPTWIQTYVATFQLVPAAGVVVGTTLVKGNPWQAMEWLWVLQGLAAAAQMNWPTTGMGNNMGVRRSVWVALGGFRDIGFSLVEDYALYQHIVQSGYGFTHVFVPEVLGWTLPPDNLVAQRNRWIRGAWKTRSPWLLLALLCVGWVPFLLCLCLVHPTLGMSLFFFTWLLGILWGRRGTRRLKWNPGWRPVVFAPLVLPIRLLIQMVHTLREPAIVWKDRRYAS